MFIKLTWQGCQRMPADGIRSQPRPAESFCHSLEFIAHELGNYSQNSTIILETGIELKKRTTFEDYDFLCIQGRNSYINCKCRDQKSDIGLSFLYISNFKLSYVRVMKCCGAVNMYTSVILIRECSNINIDKLHLNDHWFGNALTLINSFWVCQYSRMQIFK